MIAIIPLTFEELSLDNFRKGLFKLYRASQDAPQGKKNKTQR
jgi:hypothetical protein